MAAINLTPEDVAVAEELRRRDPVPVSRTAAIRRAMINELLRLRERDEAKARAEPGGLSPTLQERAN